MTNHISLSEKVYASILRLYPSRYRRDFGEQMFLDFQDMYVDAQNSNDDQAILKLWIKLIPDFLLSLCREYMYEKKGGEYILKKEFDTLGLIFWILVGIAAFPVTYFASMYLVSLLGGNIESQLTWIVFIPVLLVSFVGSQWIILQKYTKRAKSWLTNTLFAWVVMIASTFLFFILSTKILSLDLSTNNQSYIMLIQAVQALIYGSILGIFEKRALEGYSNTWLFIPANIIAIAMIFISIQGSVGSSADMMLIGAYPALFTGLALLFVLRKNTDRKGRLL